jgi:hypothetical protein
LFLAQGEKLAKERVKCFKSKGLEEIERTINTFVASKEVKRVISANISEDQFSFSAMVLYEPAEETSHETENP